MPKFLLSLLLGLLLTVPGHAFDIRIVNSSQGSIEAAGNEIGQVIYPTTKVNPKGFTASQWVGSGEVAATAVNAIHIKVDNNQTIFSILPRDFLHQLSGYNSYLSPDSSIYTNIEAGKGIFGGGFAPAVGDRVLINGSPISEGYTPKIGDVVLIQAENPIKYPREIVFENKFGGKVTAVFSDDDQMVIAEVLRPVLGVGRFAGSRFVGPGRIRANHPGVIDISTSVGDKVGGFQIIPSRHAMSPEMGGARTATQWMVVGPASVNGISLEGTALLFRYLIRPQYNEDDLTAPDWEARLLNRYLVEAKLGEKAEWGPLPVFNLNPGEDLPPEANRALQKVTHLRILFPVI